MWINYIVHIFLHISLAKVFLHLLLCFSGKDFLALFSATFVIFHNVNWTIWKDAKKHLQSFEVLILHLCQVCFVPLYHSVNSMYMCVLRNLWCSILISVKYVFNVNRYAGNERTQRRMGRAFSHCLKTWHLRITSTTALSGRLSLRGVCASVTSKSQMKGFTNALCWPIRTVELRMIGSSKSCVCNCCQCLYTVSQKKPDTWDIFNYLQQSWTNINNFWYRESPINMLLLMLTILQYVVKQRTSLGFPLATRAEAGAP